MMNDSTFLTGKTIHNYKFQQIIGTGGFSTIYLVYSLRFQQQFVAKVMGVHQNIESTWSTFQRETDALMHLDHPNIIRLYDFFREQMNFIQILEFCPNGSLKDEINRSGSLPKIRVISIMNQLFSALDYMHSQNISHHDIKPGNILFDAFGRPKFADFGITLKADENSSNFQCSLAYAPPEIVSKCSYDPKAADIWSLGVTIFEMCTGHLPWFKDNPDVLIKGILSGYPMLKHELDPIFIKVIDKMICPVNRRANIKFLVNLHPLPNPVEIQKYASYNSRFSITNSSSRSLILAQKKPKYSSMNNINAISVKPKLKKPTLQNVSYSLHDLLG